MSQVAFAGDQPLFEQDIGAVSLFCENVRQVLVEIGSGAHADYRALFQVIQGSSQHVRYGGA